jgi:hypothetical protein
MSKPRVYNPDRQLIVIANQRWDGGQGDGEFLTHEFVNDQMQSVAGSGGEVAVSPNLDNRVNINVTTLQTADFNDVLSALFQKMKAGLITSVPYEIRDLDGRSLHEGRCWIMKPPAAPLDRTATGRTWNLQGDEDFTFYGGNRTG